MLIAGHLLIDPDLPVRPGWVRIDGSQIVEVGEGRPLPKDETLDLGGDDCLITPGFIDAHTHLPQFDSIGCDGLPLLDWLDRVIYPAERAWADSDVARKSTLNALRRLLHSGTTGFAGYLTSHATSILNAMEALREIPMRAIIGRVLMDRNAPEDLLDHSPWNAHEYLPDDARRDELNDRVEISMNPRFAIACSDDALRFAGELAGESTGRFVQTHLAESMRECREVAELFSNCESYANVYDAFGLLHSRTLAAHCNHLSDDDWSLLAARGVVAVHCPTANVFLKSGYFELDAAQQHEVHVALGTDVAAGPDVAMPRVARAMIETAKWRRTTVAPDAIIPTAADAWRMITRGNAEALGWNDAGRIEVGAQADLLAMRPEIEFDTHVIGRLIYNWHDEWIKAVVLNGQAIRF